MAVSPSRSDWPTSTPRRVISSSTGAGEFLRVVSDESIRGYQHRQAPRGQALHLGLADGREGGDR